MANVCLCFDVAFQKTRVKTVAVVRIVDENEKCLANLEQTERDFLTITEPMSTPEETLLKQGRLMKVSFANA